MKASIIYSRVEISLIYEIVITFSITEGYMKFFTLYSRISRAFIIYISYFNLLCNKS